MDVITPPPPHPPPKPPHRVQKTSASRSWHVQKVERWPNTANTDAKGDTDRKTPKKTMRNGPPSRFLDQCRPPCARFLAKNTANTDKNRNLKINFGEKVPKLEFQHVPARKSTHPRGGRRTCYQQQQQQQEQEQEQEQQQQQQQQQQQELTTTSMPPTTTTTTKTTTRTPTKAAAATTTTTTTPGPEVEA